MRSFIVIDKTGRGLLCLALVVLLAALAVGPGAALGADITVTGGSGTEVGKLPWILTAFVIQPGNDILPPGGTDYYIFTLFDTGSDRIRFALNKATTLVVADGDVRDIRLYGMGAIDSTNLALPVPVGPAQVDVPTITVSLVTPYPNRTLIGGPVTNFVKAVIDYTKIIARGPYTDPFFNDINGASFEGPDIKLYPAGSPVGYTPAITLSLQKVVSAVNPSPAKAGRYYMHGVSFNNGSLSVASPASGDLRGPGIPKFLFDTGTTVTELDDSYAPALGLDLNNPDFTQPMSGGGSLPGFYLEITMTGAEGTYTVSNAPVVFVNSLSGDAVIGSNIFSQVRLLFDGPNATLGIDVPSANNPPVANAGVDQVIEATGQTTPFTLDGTLSSDPDGGDTITYSWKDANGNVVGTEATVTLSRALGTYIFTLTVTDDPGGLTSEDTVSITIRDTTPPVLIAPPDVTVSESDPMGTAVSLGSPTVSDICDPNPSVTYIAPALYPLGVTTVIWKATDASGNVSSAPQKVTVVPGTPGNQLSNLAKLINYSVASGGIAPEMQTSLLAKTNAAIATLLQGNPNATKTAMQELKALVNQIEAQTDKKIAPAVAAELVTRANRIIVALGG